ncbi:hypothetical protein HanPI659440_Chr16g0653231 [Helianthus annuus]|nr:hypothetical protein HanPI659440_Chr16g0653231 [Helianthus annuus]
MEQYSTWSCSAPGARSSHRFLQRSRCQPSCQIQGLFDLVNWSGLVDVYYYQSEIQMGLYD